MTAASETYVQIKDTQNLETPSVDVLANIHASILQVSPLSSPSKSSQPYSPPTAPSSADLHTVGDAPTASADTNLVLSTHRFMESNQSSENRRVMEWAILFFLVLLLIGMGTTMGLNVYYNIWG